LRFGCTDAIFINCLSNRAAAGTFGLVAGAPVVAGPYEYFLFRGGAGAGASDDWYLRSDLPPGPGPGPGPGPTPEPPVIVPEPPVIVGPGVPPGLGPIPEPPVPPGPRRPRFRQEVSLYAAMPVMASIYGRKIIDTLHERMGGDAQLLGPGKEDMPDGMWGRIIGYWGHRDGDAVGIFGRDGPAFDYDFGAIQSGLDLYRNEYANGQRDNAGLYLAVGRGHADVEHNLLGRTFKGGEDDFDAVSVGGYWTRFGEKNWYLDGVVQGTWYDMDMTSRRGLRDGETSAFGFAASLEGGYPFDLGNDWLLEPQAQLVYQNLNIDDFNDGAADVRYSDTDSLAGRIGARVARDWDVEGDPKRKFTLWGRADLWHEFLDDPTTEFSSATGFIPFTADLGDTWGKLGIGAARQVNDATTFYANVNYETSFDGDADAWEGKVGLKVQW
jgi:outer membrane autotransporter protein